MNISVFRQQLNDFSHSFATTLAFIEKYYQYQPTAFVNGDLYNAKAQNEGSCKIIALAVLEDFSDQEALLAFGEHYRYVLETPTDIAHQNIRMLLKFGLKAVRFDLFPLLRLNVH